MTQFNIPMPKPMLRAHYQLFSVNPETGKRTKLTEMFGNTMLLSGMNEMPNQTNWMSACQVGVGNTPAADTDTALEGFFAGTITTESDVFGAEPSAPFFGWRNITYRFAVGLFDGSPLSEVGVGWSPLAGATLVSRALIVNSQGATTTVTPLANEYLDVLVQMRIYPPLIDATGQVTLNTVVYNYICRASQVTDSGWGQFIGDGVGQVSTGNNDWQAYSDVIGTIEQAPFGVAAPCDNANQANQAYSNNSFEIGMQCNTGAGSGIGNAWNLTGGIRSIRIKTMFGFYQTQFGEGVDATGNKIPKDDGFTMQMVWDLGWGGI